jgi:hypothetical protein
VIRLLRSELLRARSRRLVAIAFVAVVAGPLIGISIGVAQSHPPPPDVEARAQQAYERELQSCLDGAYLGPGAELPPGFPDLETFCAEAVGRPEDFMTTSSIQLSGLDPIMQGTATIVVGLALILGASLMGADASSGTLATLLTWEPGRLRVFLVRAAVVAIVAAVLTVVGEGVLAFGYRGGVALRGVADVPDWLGRAAETGGRILVVGVLWALLGYAVASLTRSTAGGIGVLVAELVLVEGFLRGLVPSVARWTLIQNAVGWIGDRPYAVESSAGFDAGSLSVTTPNEALLTIVAIVGAVSGLALVAFARRDIT